MIYRDATTDQICYVNVNQDWWIAFLVLIVWGIYCFNTFNISEANIQDLIYIIPIFLILTYYEFIL